MMFRRNPVISSRNRMAGELTESFDHLRKATDAGTDAAKEAFAAGARMAQREVPPRVDRALAGLTPVIEAAAGLQTASRKSARKLEKRARRAQQDARHAVGEGSRRTNGAVLALRGERRPRRWPLAVAAVTAGFVAGAAASMAVTRLLERPAADSFLEDAALTDQTPADETISANGNSTPPVRPISESPRTPAAASR
jgi:hypothetical protein